MTMFDPEENAAPLPALSTLMQRAMEIASKHGLSVQQFGIHPNLDPDGPHHANVLSILDDDWNPDKTEEVDPEFQRVIDEARKADEEQRTTAARESLEGLRDNLRDPRKGFL